MRQLSKSEKTYQVIINIIMILVVIVIAAPFILLFMSSITDESILLTKGYSFFPSKFSLQSYAYIVRSSDKVFRAYGISILLTTIGTLANVFLSAMMAYTLTVKDLPGRKILSFFVFFTMLFNGGIVPSYLIWSGVFHVKDTLWGQLLPNLLCSAWNVVMMRTYFTGNIPASLYEAAEIDGAGQFRIFGQIVLPLGKPILVTMGTFAGLAYWNDWTNGLYYILKNKNLYNIQNLLNAMVSNLQFLAKQGATTSEMAAQLPRTGVQMAIAFVAILPIMLIFPFFFKYYSKGITMGAVKG